MNSNKAAAYKLRVAGHSYNEISAKLGTPKSTLNGWFKGLVLSDVAQARLQGRVRQGTLNSFVKRNKLQTHIARQRVLQIRREFKKLVPKLTKKDLLLAGAILYWAEGYKRPLVRYGREITSHSISFVNSDPEMVKVFILFLTTVLHVPLENLRLSMRLYAHINEQDSMRYWRAIAGVPESCFRKTTYLVSGASKRKRPYTRLPHGTLQVAVYSTEKFSQLMGLLEGVKERLTYDKVSQLLG